MRATILIVLTILGTRLYASEAWWLGQTYEPKEFQIEGIPVKTLDDSFLKASVLTAKIVEKSNLEATQDLKKNGIIFSFEDKREGVPRKCVVGVYEEKKEKGRFLLILEKKDKIWEKAFLTKDSSGPKFSGLMKSKYSYLSWCSCMECDGCQEIVWDKKSGYSLKVEEDEYSN